jgi:hypothetical protein
MEQQGKLVSTWEAMIKNADKEAEIHTLHKYEFTDTADEAQFISNADPTLIRPSRARSKPHTSDLTVLDVPDIHCGFRRVSGELLIPIHNVEAIDITLQIARDTQPDLVIFGGDILDNPNMGKYTPDSDHFVDTLQLSINALYKIMARFRAELPNARMINTRGNHDDRIEKDLLRNAPAFYGLKQANMPDNINTEAFLLRMNELEIENAAGLYRITPDFGTLHGEYAVANGSTAHRYLGKYAINSIMFHHSHRREHAEKVSADGSRQQAFSFGCLCDTKGSIPANGNIVDDKNMVVERYMNWNNGAGIVEVSKTGKVKPIDIPIDPDDYEAWHEQRLYTVREEVADALRKGQ